MMIDLTIIILFLIANCTIGWLSGRHIVNVQHFSVGSRSFNSFAIFATLAATFIGGGYTLGNAAKVYEIGMVYPFALLGFSLKEIIVATLIAPRMDNYRDCVSIGDIMAKSYGRTAKIITGIFSMIICAGILGAQVGAMGAIFNRFFSMPAYWGIFISFGVIIFYATIGGMRAVVYTDILQFLVLVIGIPLAFFMGLYHIGGWQALMAKIPEHHIYFMQSKHDLIFFITLFVTFIFGETMVPPYVQRLLMGKSAQHTKRGTLAAGILSIPFFLIVGGIGLLALWHDPNIEANTALPYIVQTQLPPFLRGFVVAGLLSIIMSSAAGFLNAGAVAFVNDVIEPLNPGVDAKSLLRYAKLSTIIVGVGSVVFAMLINNVLDILLMSYNFWSPIIIIPLVAIILGFNPQARDFMFGASAGVIAAIIWTWLAQPYQINSALIGVLANFIVFSVSYNLNRLAELKVITNGDKPDVPA